MPAFWKITTLTSAAAAVLLAGCSSSHSSAPSSSAPGGQRGSGLKAIASCLSSHGADPTSLSGVLTGTPLHLNASQAATLQKASQACESQVPASVKSRLTATVTCLDGHGYHLDAGAPLSSLFSLRLSQPGVSAALQSCSGRSAGSGRPARSSSAAGSS